MFNSIYNHQLPGAKRRSRASGFVHGRKAEAVI
jgi:hypothetical protein